MNPRDEFSGKQLSPIKRQLHQLQGPRPSPLKVYKDSHIIKKPPIHPPPKQPEQPTPESCQPGIIYTVSPKVIHTTANEFMGVVLRLTGLSTGDISPAARLATIEKTRPSGRERGMIDGFEVRNFPGILSPAPASLPQISDRMFSSSSSKEKSRPITRSWEKGKLLGHGSFGSVYEGISEMEVLLDFHKSEGTLLDITELFGLLENVEQYEFLKSKSVAVRKLKVIYIRNSKIPEIPNNLSFPDLEELYLQSNLHLSYIPFSFFKQMPALKVLNMSNTSIKTLPPPVSELFKLEQLIMQHCQLLMELPPEIGALGNLKVLDLEGTDLVCLPDELKELTKLKCLKVSLYDAESYRKSKKIVAIIPVAILSRLTQLEELSINVDPQDVWCISAMKAIMEDLPSLRKLQTLKLYLPTTELLKNLMELKWNNDDVPIYQNLSNFSVIIGPRAQPFLSRLPCDLEEEFLKLKRCLKYNNGEDTTTQFAEALKHANALYLDRHWTIKKLSTFNLEDSNELKFCLLVDCNEMQAIFEGSDFSHGAANKGENILSLQYLAIHYLKNLEVIWKGPGVGCCSNALRVLTLHMCPNLTTISPQCY